MRRRGAWVAVGLLTGSAAVGINRLSRLAEEAATSAGWSQWQVDWIRPGIAVAVVLAAIAAGRLWGRISGRRAAAATSGDGAAPSAVTE